MSAPLGELEPVQFLEQYWPKTCLVRQAFKSFAPLIDGDDLAGLACEEMAGTLCADQQPKIRADMLDQASLEALTEHINNGHFVI